MMPYHAVSLSGGKDSTAMLLMMLDRGMPIDEVVWFDGGWEFPEMHDHIALVERNTGVSVTRLKPEKSFDYWMFDHVRTRGKYKGKAGWGWARPMARWCTKIKTSTINAHLLSNADGREIVQHIGIAADETHRCRGLSYPLVDWGVTEADALAYCLDRGYDWGGLYDANKRVSCWCCPLQSLDALRALRASHPELWADLLDMDERSWNDFRIGYPASKLDERFAREELQIKLQFLNAGDMGAKGGD